jgi:phage tail sheath protein FI
MPEYLAPGVYTEEVSFRAKSIEGVATSTTGYAGLTRYGPVQFTDDVGPGPRSTEPRLITSFTEFERVYGGLDPLTIDRGDGIPISENYLAHAARAFFLNGGTRLYISRVFAPVNDPDDWGVARSVLNFPNDSATWRARWPGVYGNVLVTVRAVRKPNVAFPDVRFGNIIQAKALTRGAVVEITPGGQTPLVDGSDLDVNLLAVVDVDNAGRQTFRTTGGGTTVPDTTSVIKEVVLRVTVDPDGERLDVYNDLATHPGQRRWIGKIMQAHDPEDENALIYLDTAALDDPDNIATLERAIGLMAALETRLNGAPEPASIRLTGGNDGTLPGPDSEDGLLGHAADPDDATNKATGLEALGEIDDIAIVALPDGGAYIDDENIQAKQAAEALIGHAERERYRIAVIDAPQGSSLTEIRDFRGRFDSTYAALYHPWVEILDPLERPTQGAPPRRILLPPSGFVTGIYARNDIQRGVFKAPANEVVRGLTRFEANINKARQDVLNPEGINALRFFEGRGNRVWGARTISSDPEWKYVNVRRFFIFLEHSIDKAMQFAVFEPNGPQLWSNIRRTVEDFLFVQWTSGALLGSKPAEAFFVRCDRTTMSQNDLDNGRLIALIGVAPVKPAEFVIFRIGQFTADAKS